MYRLKSSTARYHSRMVIPSTFRNLLTGNREPQTLEDFLVYAYHPLAELKPKYRGHIVQMVADWQSRKVRHESYPDYMVMSKGYLEKVWGNDKTAKKILGGEYFAIIDADRRAGGKPRGFKPHPHWLEALTAYDQRKKLERSVQTSTPALATHTMPDAAEVLNQSPSRAKKGLAIASRVSIKGGQKAVERKSRWAGAGLSTRVALSVEGLRVCADQDNEARNRHAAINLLEECMASPDGCSLDIRYVQKSSGRIYSAHQRIPRDVRAAAFDGCWKYDISNCHYTILSSLGRRFQKSTAAIDQYLKNKPGIRQQLAVETSADIDAVKAALIAIAYGVHLRAKSGRTPIGWRDSTLSEILAGDDGIEMGKQRATVFIESSLVRSLQTDIVGIRTDAIDGMLSPGMKQRLTDFKSGKPVKGGVKWVNAFGEAIGLKGHPKSSNITGQVPAAAHITNTALSLPTKTELLAHCLQGIEAKALKSIVDVHGERLLLLLHDGFISRTRLDLDHLERLIKQATGYELRLEEEQLCYGDVLAKQHRTFIDVFSTPATVDDGTLVKQESSTNSSGVVENKGLFDNFAPVCGSVPAPPRSPPGGPERSDRRPRIWAQPEAPKGMNEEFRASISPKWARTRPNPA